MPGEEPIGLLIGAVRRRIKQAVGQRVRRYQLTTQQFWVLVAMHEYPGLSLGDLAARLRMDKPTASRLVSALLKRRLVRVEVDAADRRRSRLRPGPAGVELGAELLDLAASVRAAAVRGLAAAEQNALRASLRKVIANMDHFQEDDADEKAPAAGEGLAAGEGASRS